MDNFQNPNLKNVPRDIRRSLCWCLPQQRSWAFPTRQMKVAGSDWAHGCSCAAAQLGGFSVDRLKGTSAEFTIVFRYWKPILLGGSCIFSRKPIQNPMKVIVFGRDAWWKIAAGGCLTWSYFRYHPRVHTVDVVKWFFFTDSDGNPSSTEYMLPLLPRKRQLSPPRQWRYTVTAEIDTMEHTQKQARRNLSSSICVQNNHSFCLAIRLFLLLSCVCFPLRPLCLPFLSFYLAISICASLYLPA